MKDVISNSLELIKTSNIISKILLEKTDRPLESILRLLGEVTKVSRAYIFKFDLDKKTMSNTYEYVAPNELQTLENPHGIRAEKNDLQNLPLEIFPDWMVYLEQKSPIIITNMDKCDFLPETKKNLIDQDIIALIVAPIYFDDKLEGFIGFDECKSTRDWTQEEIEFLESNVDNISNFMKSQLIKQELLESEKKYRELVEKAPVGIFLSNSKGQILHINSELTRIVGANSREDVICNSQDLEFDFYENPNRRKEFIESLQKHGKVDNFICKTRKLKGKKLWISISAKIREIFPDGTFLIEGFVSDITKQKQAEKIILNQERLSAIGDFASSIAHDFNNTLQGMIGNIELVLLEPELSSEIIEYMN